MSDARQQLALVTRVAKGENCPCWCAIFAVEFACNIEERQCQLLKPVRAVCVQYVKASFDGLLQCERARERSFSERCQGKPCRRLATLSFTLDRAHEGVQDRVHLALLRTGSDAQLMNSALSR